jgi:hypothetical protein
MFNFRSADGAVTMPSVGPTFTTFNGFQSRRVSSWYFGDGVTLFNSLPSSLRQGQTLTTADSALGRGASSTNGAGFGGRVSYAITSRLSAEFTIDYSMSAVEIDPAVLSAVETSRTAYLTAWNSLLTGMAPNVTSSSLDDDGSIKQLATVGLIVYKLTDERRLTPFLTGGIGMITNLGDAPSVTLSAQYSFKLSGIWPFTESDLVTIRYGLADHDLVGVFGGGFTYAFGARQGLRVDARLMIGGNSATTTLQTTSGFLPLTPIQTLAVTTSPSVQWSNNQATGATSSLSGQDLRDFETFSGSGLAQTLSVTAGWYFRF